MSYYGYESYPSSGHREDDTMESSNYEKQHVIRGKNKNQLQKNKQKKKRRDVSNYRKPKKKNSLEMETSNCALFVGNVPIKITKEDLTDFFTAVMTKLGSTNAHPWCHYIKRNGIAYVSFADPADVELVLSHGDRRFDDTTLVFKPWRQSGISKGSTASNSRTPKSKFKHHIDKDDYYGPSLGGDTAFLSPTKKQRTEYRDNDYSLGSKSYADSYDLPISSSEDSPTQSTISATCGEETGNTGTFHGICQTINSTSTYIVPGISQTIKCIPRKNRDDIRLAEDLLLPTEIDVSKERTLVQQQQEQGLIPIAKQHSAEKKIDEDKGNTQLVQRQAESIELEEGEWKIEKEKEMESWHIVVRKEKEEYKQDLKDFCSEMFRNANASRQSSGTTTATVHENAALRDQLDCFRRENVNLILKLETSNEDLTKSKMQLGAVMRDKKLVERDFLHAETNVWRLQKDLQEANQKISMLEKKLQEASDLHVTSVMKHHRVLAGQGDSSAKLNSFAQVDSSKLRFLQERIDCLKNEMRSLEEEKKVVTISLSKQLMSSVDTCTRLEGQLKAETARRKLAEEQLHLTTRAGSSRQGTGIIVEDQSHHRICAVSSTTPNSSPTSTKMHEEFGEYDC